MGIQKLRKCLKLFASSYNFTEPIPRGSTLLVDFTGYLYNVLLRYQESNVRDRLYFGDFFPLHEFVTRELTFLTQQLGMKLVVYVDGDQDCFYHEGDITTDKMETNQEKWTKFRELLSNNGQISSPAIQSIVDPPCAYAQILESIRMFNETHLQSAITIHQAIGDADYSIGQKYREMLRSKNSCFVYGADTDFAFMTDVKLILCEDAVELHFRGGERCSSVVNTKVYSRNKLKDGFALNDNQLTDLALLLGTDYNVQFERSSFSPLQGSKKIPLGFSDKMLGVLMEQLRASNRPLSTNDKLLLERMAYTKALFELDSRIERFHTPNAKRINGLAQVCGEECPFALSDLQTDTIQGAVDEYLTTCDEDEVDCLELVKLILASNRDIIFPLIKDNHMSAISKMIDLLQGKEVEGSDQLELDSNIITYEMLEAASSYQLIMRSILDSVRLRGSNGKPQAIIERLHAKHHVPYEFYHGKIFFAFAAQSNT